MVDKKFVLEPIDDSLLDSSGVLIPKKTSFYSPEELTKFKEKQSQQPSLLFPQPLTGIKPMKKINEISDILGIEIEEEAVEEPALFGSGALAKRIMAYDAAQKSIASGGFERFLMPYELVKIYELGKAGNGHAMTLYHSIVKNPGEWFNMAWSSQNSEIIIYEKPVGLRQVIGFPKGIQQTGYSTSNICYDAKHMQHHAKLTFKLKNISIGTRLPLSAYPQLFEYFIGIKVDDYPVFFPDPLVEFPDQPYEVWPLSFEMEHGRMTIKGYSYRACRGVKKVNK